MHGILSLHGRKKADNWTCLVCSADQPWLEKNEVSRLFSKLLTMRAMTGYNTGPREGR